MHSSSTAATAATSTPSSTVLGASWPLLCRDGVCAVKRERASKVPTAFNEDDMGKHLRCSNDGLTIAYEGPDDSEENACSVRTHLALPNNGVALFYFEVHVDDAGIRGNIGVGLCGRNVKLEKMPGWEKGSFGYHGDDGLLFTESGQSGHKYGPKYGTGDVIGCCVNLLDNYVFFTKNGQFLGKAFDLKVDGLYPSIGMQTRGGRITANFGRRPFKYDIENYARQQRLITMNNIREHPLPADYRLLEGAVLGYLVHQGYAETAAAFARDAGRPDEFASKRKVMLERKRVCAQVMKGDIDGALSLLKEKFPGVLSAGGSVPFLLHTQKFIEMIVGGATLEETVAYGKKTLSAFRTTDASSSATVEPDDDISYVDTLEQVYSLLAYVNPSNSPYGHLTGQSRRDMVAGKLNAAILRSQGRPTRSVLERLVSHCEQVLDEALKQRNGAVALVSVKDFL